MTSDREDRRVRRGHAWAREAQDFALRHAQDPLPSRSRLSSLSTSLSPFFCSSSPSKGGLPRPSRSLSPRNSARLAGVMLACAQLCLHTAWYVALSGGWRDEQWLLRAASTFLPFASSRKTTRICLRSLMHARRSYTHGGVRVELDALRSKSWSKRTHYVHVILLLAEALLCFSYVQVLHEEIA